MKTPWIENYLGVWCDDEGRTLIIKTLDDTNAQVDLIQNGSPIKRPWCGNKPSAGMHATYDFKEGPELNIHLGYDGFTLSVSHIFDNPLMPNDEETLAVGVSQYEDDVELNQYLKIFGKLGYYKRSAAEPVN